MYHAPTEPNRPNTPAVYQPPSRGLAATLAIAGLAALILLLGLGEARGQAASPSRADRDARPQADHRQTPGRRAAAAPSPTRQVELHIRGETTPGSHKGAAISSGGAGRSAGG